MAASNQPIGFLAIEALLYGWKSMPQRAKGHNSCVTSMLKIWGTGPEAAISERRKALCALNHPPYLRLAP
jgi:hypothetical protein